MHRGREMRRGAAISLGVLMALLGLADAGQAQPPASVQVQATIRAVDCTAQTVTLGTGGRAGVYRTVPAATITVNSTGVQLCTLQHYVGAHAVVWLAAFGNELVITRLDAAVVPPQPVAPYAPAPYAPAPYAPAPYAPGPYAPLPYAPAHVPAAPIVSVTPAFAPPLVGVVLGTIVVAGLVYLLVRHPSGALYRYPYYGPYYRVYYRPVYRPYYGPLFYTPAYTYGPYRWCPGYRAWGYWCR
jgi:hypothetical protein